MPERINFKRDFERIIKQVAGADVKLVDQMLQERREEINRLRTEMEALALYRQKIVS